MRQILGFNELKNVKAMSKHSFSTLSFFFLSKRRWGKRDQCFRVTSISRDFRLVWRPRVEEWLKIDSSRLEEVCGSRMRERRRANTWASPPLCRPTDSTTLRCFSPNRSFLSPSRSIADLLSSSALDTLPLWLSPTTPNHPPAVFRRKVCACPASSGVFSQESVTGAGKLTAGGEWMGRCGVSAGDGITGFHVSGSF